MTARKKTVVIGLAGTVLDAGKGPRRWEKWRPSVALCQHDDLLVDRFELLYAPGRFEGLKDQLVQDLARVSPETTVVPRPIALNNPWDLEEVYGALHDFARAYRFQPEREEYLVHITTGTHIAQICMFLLVESRYIPGRLLQTAPARKGQAGPGTYAIIDLDLQRYDRLASRFGKEQREGLSLLKSGIDTRNPAFNALIERIEKVASSTRDPLLLTGPTGAGKSRLARRIFELKQARRKLLGEFVEVNCATLRGDNAMATLFGHAKGAFTGAIGERPGLLRKADGGLLFLDEIGELGADEQAMLLRAIEEKAFYPLGSDKEVRSDFQLIAGTNRDLRTGGFREDLLARINLWTFRLPELRERPEDIEPNLAYELEQCAKALSVNVTFNQEARAEFVAFAKTEARWPGNFRDFAAAVRRMATLADGGRITLSLVREEVERLRELSGERLRELSGDRQRELSGEQSLLTGKKLDRFDRVQLEEVLRVCRRSRSLSDAGRELFAVSRAGKKSTNDADRLRKYLARFDLDWSVLTA